MENEAPAVPGYVNRPTGHDLDHRVETIGSGRHEGLRSSMRIARVALRAYEQRAERRAWMHSWLIAQIASAPAR